MTRKTVIRVPITILINMLMVSCSSRSAFVPNTPTEAPTAVQATPTEPSTQTTTPTPVQATPTEQLPPTSPDQWSCIQPLSSGSTSVFDRGSILFYYYGPGSITGVWGISIPGANPKLAFQPTPPGGYDVVLSPDGTKLAWDDFSKLLRNWLLIT